MAIKLTSLLATAGLAQAQSTIQVLTGEDQDATITINVPAATSATDAGSFTSGKFTSKIPFELRDWDPSANICYVSRMEKKRASPSLRNCYTTTDNACCNFIEDE